MKMFPLAILAVCLLAAGPGSTDALAQPCNDPNCPACHPDGAVQGDEWTYGAVYPDTFAAQQNGCCCCCCCLEIFRPEIMLGPGDLHPHYAYCPAFHGYYYFRPYNHMHVLYDAAAVAAWGGDPRAPYSVEFLRPQFAMAAPEPRGYVPAPFADNLPKLEDLLPGGRMIEVYPPIEGARKPAIEAPEPSISRTGYDELQGPSLY